MNFYLSFIYILIFLFGKVPPLPQINGYTHWSVSSNGMVVPITTSFFQMRQPWALMKLLKQEDDCDFIQTVDMKLNQVSDNLKFNQQYQQNVQKIYVDSNSACVKSSKLMAEFDLHSTHILTLETKGIQSQAYLKDESLININLNEKLQLKEPFCDSYFNLTFSLCCFEHLEAIRNRSSFTGVPEISLYKVALPQHLTPAEYGHLVQVALHEHHSNPSDSWILYNMAAFYWRVKGSSKNAIECLRAALHTSPEKFLDVALVSLSNVLHLIKSTSKDAVTLMKNAILISPHFSSHHIILGNIFASLGEFNESLYHFEMAAKLHKPEKDKTKLKDIEDRIFAARCSHELSIAISAQQTNLNKQLKELNSFQHSTEQYHNAKTSIELERINNQTQKKRQTVYEAFIEEEEKQTKGLMQCSKFDPVTKQMVACQSIERNVVVPLFQNLSSGSSESPTTGNRRDHHNPTFQRKYKKIHPHLTNTNQDFENIIQTDCKTMKCFNLRSNKNYDRYTSVYLSPRNKGFELDNVLTSTQGLQDNEEHPLPWHPPYCTLYVDKGSLPLVDTVDNLATLKRLNDIKNNNEEFPQVVDQILFLELIKLVNNSKVRLEDIGQRIVTAITHKLAPLWIVLNIAGLYWRVTGNLLHAIDCQKLSAKLSPLQFRDVPMVNLAAVLLKLNQTEDAMRLTKSALQIDYSEPATHILAAGLFKKYENYYLSFQHINIAIEQEPLLDLSEEEWHFIKCQLCIKEAKKSLPEEPPTEIDGPSSISYLFMRYNMCSSIRECSNIMPTDCFHLPHIKISTREQIFSNMNIDHGQDILTEDDNDISQIVYGFFWNMNISNFFILENDCVVINNSVRTGGCYRKEVLNEASQNSLEFLSELRTLIHDVSENSSRQVEQTAEVTKQSCHSEHVETTVANKELQSTTSHNSQKLYDDIVKLISARVILNPLAIEDCEQVAPFDFKTYAPLYVSLNTMQVNVAALLDSFTPSYSFSFSHQPYCFPKGDNIYLQHILEKHKIDFQSSQYSKVPEYNLHASFLKTFDDKYSLDEIGRRLYVGLEKNSSDWRLATIVVNYWRVYGDAGEAFKCLQVAMENSPDYHLKVILVNAANILYRINKYDAALEVSYRALKRPDGHKWIVIPFLVANIFATIEQWQKATLFYEFCLAIKDNFDETIYRIKSIQCQQMVFKNLEQH